MSAVLDNSGKPIVLGARVAYLKVDWESPMSRVDSIRAGRVVLIDQRTPAISVVVEPEREESLRVMLPENVVVIG